MGTIVLVRLHRDALERVLLSDSIGWGLASVCTVRAQEIFLSPDLEVCEKNAQSKKFGGVRAGRFPCLTASETMEKECPLTLDCVVYATKSVQRSSPLAVSFWRGGCSLPFFSHCGYTRKPKKEICALKIERRGKKAWHVFSSFATRPMAMGGHKRWWLRVDVGAGKCARPYGKNVFLQNRKKYGTFPFCK